MSKKLNKLILVFIFLIISSLIYMNKDLIAIKFNFIEKDSNLKMTAYVNDKYFYLSNTNEKIFLKGVNIGAGKPSYFPGEHAIAKEEYLEWFKDIKEMNANVIRIYTLHPPEFYEALNEFNKNLKRKGEEPLYILHGVWLEEELINELLDGFNPEIEKRFDENILKTIDVIHGNKKIKPQKGYASGTYEADISEYVIGYILGIEWYPDFVIGTNEKQQPQYNGKYLYTENANSFEIFLTVRCDKLLTYEQTKYNRQTPISFVNWVTTDILEHKNEPYPSEDAVSIDSRNIKRKETLKSGMFSSYHIYPYYPDALIYEKNYREYIDDKGKVNTYKAYLEKLIKEYDTPVLVAEFGIPSSRGLTHKNPYMNFNQGFTDECTQGKQVKEMMQDIYDTGYAGGLVFTWQDEWFKRTWNTVYLTLPERRAYWSDVQTNEQNFGLVAFDNSDPQKNVNIDGDISDWQQKDLLSYSQFGRVYAKSNEKYFYLMINTPIYEIEEDTLIFAINSIQNQGNKHSNEFNLDFDEDVDFLIQIRKNDSRITVDSYYDTHYYHFAEELKTIPEKNENKNKNSGNFNPMELCLHYGMVLPQDKVELPYESYETGALRYGNSNPNSKEFDSLADYYIKGNIIEVRIPWQLLNVMDPSSKQIVGDMYEKTEEERKRTFFTANGVKEYEYTNERGIKPIDVEKFNIQSFLLKKNGAILKDSSKSYYWDRWDVIDYNKRLKKSYYILQDFFKTLN